MVWRGCSVARADEKAAAEAGKAAGETIAKLSGGGIRCRQGMAHCSTADARWLNAFNVLPAIEQW
jgi:hypothetical protein